MKGRYQGAAGQHLGVGFVGVSGLVVIRTPQHARHAALSTTHAGYEANCGVRSLWRVMIAEWGYEGQYPHGLRGIYKAL